MVSRVEKIESTKDGSEVLSFKLKNSPPVRLRCSPFARDMNDQYKVGEEIILTPWRSPSGVLSPVELLPVPEHPGHYVLHEESKRRLQELGYVPTGEKKDVCSRQESAHMSLGEELEEGYYEVEEVLEQRLHKDMMYEFKVRFKGYGPDDDMWLPASSFNRTVSFQTISRFGRKRKHKTDDKGSTFTERTKSRKVPKLPKNSRQEPQGCQPDQGERGKGSRKTGEENQSKQKRETSSGRLSSKGSKSAKKGKSFRSSLPSLTQKKRLRETTKPYIDQEQKEGVITLSSDDGKVHIAATPATLDEQDVESSIIRNLCRRDVNFATPRRLLVDARLPIVDHTIQLFTIKFLDSEQVDEITQDPLTVDRVPAVSVITESMDALLKTKRKKEGNGLNFVVDYASYGCFTLDGVRILSRYDILRTVEREVHQEEKWLEQTFKGGPEQQKTLVTEALLDNWNAKGQYLVQRKGYTIKSQELSVLCCERYLTDEIINLFISKYCDTANDGFGRSVFAMLPSDVSTQFQTSAVHHLNANVELSTVETIFLPIHRDGNHWGLLVFNVNKRCFEYDDGFHYPKSLSIQELADKTLASLYEISTLQHFRPSAWMKVQRFKVPMPDQPNASGSCRVGVIYCVRDLTRGIQEKFPWTFKESPKLRAQLMIELLKG